MFGVEKGVPHRKRPDGKLLASNHRQFRCYCPLWLEGVAVKQESIPWQSFVFDAVPVIHDSKHFARPCSTGIPACVLGLGDDDFQF
jgi:hypothetical protein